MPPIAGHVQAEELELYCLAVSPKSGVPPWKSTFCGVKSVVTV
jgi:hypothetical protein